ncbi:MAG: methyltransferase domain-containing protein [Casimicrobium sp.]|jgi:ubiquinone/menaquinone biosynthesis C-methylase UbiE
MSTAVSLPILDNLGAMPDRQRALVNYRHLANNYDSTCVRIEVLRRDAVRALGLEAGQTVFDIACGTGSTLPLLAEGVGASGKVVGVELSPEMAAQARRHAGSGSNAAVVQVECCAVEDFQPTVQADAVLLSYTHDVLQSPAAIERLLAFKKPNARFVLLGMKTLPWLWGWPVNAFNLYRARRYLTTYANIGRPWAALEARGAKIEIIQTALWGSAYIATATFNTSTTLHVRPTH